MLTILNTTGVEPVTLAEAKLAARVDSSDLDAFITAAIEVGRTQAEQITGRLYRQQTLREQLVSWPSCGNVVIPVLAATACAISYWNGSSWATLMTTAYVFGPSADFGGARTELAPAYGTTWPVLGNIAVGPRVRIDLTAGPATAAMVPEAVKLYIKACVSGWVNTGDYLVNKQMVPNPMLDSLLDAERLWC